MAADIVVSRDGQLSCGGLRLACVLGRGGVVPAGLKREGDGATPAGSWPLRRLYHRADRVAPPATGLEVRAIGPDDGWCDDPADPRYNRPVRLPFAASHERMWRQDGLYDLVVEVGYNDDPVEPGRGSAIFVHVAAPDRAPTAGCVAMTKDELAAILPLLGPGSRLVVRD